MISHLRPAQLPQWLDTLARDGTVPVVLDVREPWERTTASVVAQGFELVSIPMGSIPSQFGTLDPSRPVACLCHHGVRSLRVAAYLVQQGFDNVSNITGGIDAWSHELDPSVPVY